MKVIKPLTFSNFEFERASSATYYNSSGVLSVAAVDVLRESYNPNTLVYEGPIFENAATNLVPYSNDFSEWTPFNSATGIGVETPPVNPDASLPVQFMQPLGTSAWQVYQDVGALSGLYTFSIFTKVKTPQAGTLSEVTISVLGGTFLGFTRFNINAAAPAVLSANRVISNSIQQINNGWLRLSITVNLPFDGVSRRLNIYGGAPAGGSDGKGFHYLWGAQLEEGAAPTSFIYTDGAPATRAADVQISNPPSVVSSNVDEDEAPTWAAGTAYLAGDQVQVLGAYHRLYTAVVNNTGIFPPTNTPATWIDNGSTNPWRMFDMTTGAESQTLSTSGANTIVVELSVPAGTNSAALLNITGGRVIIAVRDTNGATVAEYDEYLLGFPPGVGWWDFFFGDRTYKDLVLHTDFSLPAGGTISVTVEGGTSPAGLGKLIVGSAFDIGCARFGTSAGIIDFSRKERDAFGNNFIVERRYIDKCDYDIMIETEDAYSIKRKLAALRATPAVYIGSENHLVTVVFGFYRDFSIVLQGPKKSACSLQTEGI
jgi:hypothetical protein